MGMRSWTEAGMWASMDGGAGWTKRKVGPQQQMRPRLRLEQSRDVVQRLDHLSGSSSLLYLSRGSQGDPLGFLGGQDLQSVLAMGLKMLWWQLGRNFPKQCSFEAKEHLQGCLSLSRDSDCISQNSWNQAGLVQSVQGLGSVCVKCSSRNMLRFSLT